MLNIHGHTAAWHYKATSYLNGNQRGSGGCTAVAANASAAGVAPLSGGTDYVIKAYSDSSCATELTDDITDLDFSTPGVVLNASYLLVPENDTYRHTVRLSSAPAASVTVNITTSGDADITADTDSVAAGNQTSLTFTTSNWDTPQTVTLAAADDNDTVPGSGKGDGSYAYGETILTYTATSADAIYNGLTATLKGVEADDDVCQGTTAVGGATTGDLVKECNLLMPGRDLVNGTSITYANSWNTGTAMDSWRGVAVSSGRVTEIKLPWFMYAGQNGNLPNTVGQLTELNLLDMQTNLGAVTVMPVPEGLGNLTKLTKLIIYRGRWSGEIPSSIGNLTLLEQLVIDDNYLSGPLPSTLGNLTRLTSAYIYDNSYTGPIPESLGNLAANLENLVLRNGNLTGHIPASLGDLTNLSAGKWGLGLANNRLTGCIPTSLSSRVGTDELNPQRDAAGNDVTLAVCTDGIGVSDSSVAVPEGGYADVGVRLLTAPTANVTVTVSAASGDGNLTADTDTTATGNQTTLTFTTTNWGTQQTLRISAAADSDSLSGSKTFTLTSSSTDNDYASKTATVAASENDDEATISASGITAGSAALSLAGYTSWHYRQDYPQGDSSCNAASSASATADGLRPETTYRFGAYLDSDCSKASFVDDVAFITARMRLTGRGIASTGLTLNIHGHTGAWHYKATPHLNGAELTAGSCTAVAANTASANVSSLTAGTDYVIKAYSDTGCVVEMTDDLTDVDFSTPGVVLNASYLLVPEGGTYPHTVRLSSEPAAWVTVAITTSGDADIMADTDVHAYGNQTELTFTPSNWNTPQTVTLAAAQDTDTVPQAGKGDGDWAYGDATLTYTATSSDAAYDGLTATLTAEEADDDVCQGTTAVNNATTGALVDECNLLLPGKDLANGTGSVVDNWDTGTAMNSWTGITVSDSRVTKVTFVFSNYANQNGNLPNTIGRLTELNHLEMQSNVGATKVMPVPEGLGNLTKLTQLKIYNKRWAGNIPSSIGNLAPLEELYLSDNYLSGPIPSTLGNLTSLTQAHLDNRGLAGPIPESLGNLASLTNLTLGNGSLTGRIPASLSKLTKLRDYSAGLNLSGNRLTGCIPASLRNRAVIGEINPQRDAAGNVAALAACAEGKVVSDSSVAVPEGGYADVWVRLPTSPSSSVTVAVSAASGDGDLTADTDTATSGNQSALTFTTANWGTPQKARIWAASDGDGASGSKTFTLTSSSTDSAYASKTATVAALENDDEATVSASGITSASATLSLPGHSNWHYRRDYPQGDSSCNAVSSASATVHGLTPSATYRFGAYLSSDCSNESFIDDISFTAKLADLTTAPCVRNGVTTLWPGYACYLKAGDGGIQTFDAVTLEGQSATLVELLERGGSGIGATEAMAYNPNGGTATLKTTQGGSARDTFTINVVRFGIRDFSVSKAISGTNESFTLTVRLNSPSHIWEGKYRKNSTTDLARSWVQLTLPPDSGMKGNDHERGAVTDPVQVVDQHGDTVTFTINTGTQTGTFDIAIKAYRPAPDVGCPLTGDPTKGDKRCYAPPVGSETLSYAVE